MRLLHALTLALLFAGFSGSVVEEMLLWVGVSLGPSVARGAQAQPPHLHHFAVATKANPWALEGAGALVAAQGTTLRVFGMGDTRAPSPSTGFGWAYALKLLHIQQAVAGLPPGDLVLVSDAFDAFSVAPMTRFEAGFRAAVQHEAQRQLAEEGAGAGDARPIEVLVSAEAWCFPNTSLAGDFPREDLRLPLPFPNSGVYMGRAGALHRLLTHGPHWDIAFTDDQDWFSKAYLASRRNASLPRVALDHDSIMAFSMGPLKALRRDLVWDADVGAWQDRATGSHPCIFHYNGDKDDMQRGLVPRFFYGKVCFTEHLGSCTLWALVAPAVALAVGAGALLVPWQRALLQHPRAKEVLAAAAAAPRALSPGSAALCRRALAFAATLPPSLLLSPLLTVVAFAALCPLCARPQSTVWETLEYTLWPPTQLVWGHTYEASGRAVAVGWAVIVEHALGWACAWVGGGRGAGGAWRWAHLAAPFVGGSLVGAWLLVRAGGPGTEFSGCAVVAPAILGLARLCEAEGVAGRVERALGWPTAEAQEGAGGGGVGASTPKE